MERSQTLCFKLKAVTTKDRTQAKAAPCPHCGATTRGKTLASPRCLNRGATLILSTVHDQCKKSVNFTKKTSPDAIPPRLEHRGRTRENASDPDSRSVCCSQKAPERQHHDLYSGFKKKHPAPVIQTTTMSKFRQRGRQSMSDP